MMPRSNLKVDDPLPLERRTSRRADIQCRARIVIGTRHYAGYLHNISRSGAKLETITPIGKIGKVLLQIPDLPPIRCELRWSDPHNAGVAFRVPLSGSVFSKWLRERSALHAQARQQVAEVLSFRRR